MTEAQFRRYLKASGFGDHWIEKCIIKARRTEQPGQELLRIASISANVKESDIMEWLGYGG